MKTLLAKIPRVLVLLGLIYSISDCSDTVVFKPQESKEPSINTPLSSQSIAFLNMPAPPNTAPKLHEIVLREAEKQLRSLPWKQFITRRQLQSQLKNNFLSRAAHQQLSQSLAFSGIANSTHIQQLGKTLPVELFYSLHFEHILCKLCRDKNQLWLVGQIIRIQDSQTILRIHIRKHSPEDTPEAILDTALKITRQHTNTIRQQLTPSKS